MIRSHCTLGASIANGEMLNIILVHLQVLAAQSEHTW